MRDPGALYIIRHGMRMDWSNPDWKKTAALPGDPPLDSEGESQAEVLGRRLANAGIKRIFTSPFLRCIMTANPLAELTQISILPESGLSEHITHPYFPEKPELAYHKADPERLAEKFGRLEFRYAPIPDYPESELMMEDRVTRAVRLLAEDYCIRRGESIIIVSHGGPCRYMINSLLEAADGHVPPGGVQMCSLTKLVYTGSGRTGWKAEILVEDPSADPIEKFAKGVMTWVKGLAADAPQPAPQAIEPPPPSQPAPPSAYSHQPEVSSRYEAPSMSYEQSSRSTDYYNTGRAIQHRPHPADDADTYSSSRPAPAISGRGYDPYEASSTRPSFAYASSTVSRSQKGVQSYGSSFNAGTAPLRAVDSANTHESNPVAPLPSSNSSHAAWADPRPTSPTANAPYTASAAGGYTGSNKGYNASTTTHTGSNKGYTSSTTTYTGSNKGYNASTTPYTTSNKGYNASTTAYTTSSKGYQYVKDATERKTDVRNSPRRATTGDIPADSMPVMKTKPLRVACRLCQRPANPETHGGFCYLCIGSVEYDEIMAKERKLSSGAATPAVDRDMDCGVASVEVRHQPEAPRPEPVLLGAHMKKYSRELEVQAVDRRGADVVAVASNDSKVQAAKAADGKEKDDDALGKMAGKFKSWLGIRPKEDEEEPKGSAQNKAAERVAKEEEAAAQYRQQMDSRRISVTGSSFAWREHESKGPSEYVVPPSPATHARRNSTAMVSPSALGSRERTQALSSEDRARESDRYRDGRSTRRAQPAPNGQRIYVAVPTHFSQQSALGSSNMTASVRPSGLVKTNDFMSPSYGNPGVGPGHSDGTYTPRVQDTQGGPVFKVATTTTDMSTSRRNTMADVEGFQRERAREREGPVARRPSMDLTGSVGGNRVVISASGTEAAYVQQQQIQQFQMQQQQQQAYYQQQQEAAFPTVEQAYGIPPPPTSSYPSYVHATNPNPQYRPFPQQYDSLPLTHHTQGPPAPYQSGPYQQQPYDGGYYPNDVVYTNNSSAHTSLRRGQVPIFAQNPLAAPPQQPQDPFSYGSRSLSVSYT